MTSPVNVLGRCRSHCDGVTCPLSPERVNNFFQNVAISCDHQPACNFIPPSPSINAVWSFEFSSINLSTVLLLHGRLDTRKAMDPDGISARFLREVAAEIAQRLIILYNKSLETGVIPSDWKLCNVTPVHKSGSVNDPSNYRPISVVSVFAKLLEKIVASQLSDYFETNHLLSDYQGLTVEVNLLNSCYLL